MKVLFAVNNDEISNAIVKRYQKDYKEILSYKNVYYFNAILKELQKDKTYDRVIISEDLEPFANNNFDTIDKFLFDKLDNISDEATNAEGNDTDIILICTDRRSKSDEMLIKLFGIGIYSAIIGSDRSIEEVCNLIHKPRSKKEAKVYYKIEAENVNYQSENEDSVSETEVQNILAHYKRLGKNEDKYVDSFNNIVSQYTDNQLKIIIRYLPIGVKAVLEERSPKYQELVSLGPTKYSRQAAQQFSRSVNSQSQEEKEETIKIKMLKSESGRSNMSRPVVIPSNVNTSQVKKLIKPKEQPNKIPVPEPVQDEETLEDSFDELDDILDVDTPIDEGPDIEATEPIVESFEDADEEVVAEPIVETKRGRGRPRKYPVPDENQEAKPKRGRGRPRKNPVPEEVLEEEKDEEEDIDLFGLDDDQETTIDNTNEEDIDLFDIDDDEDIDLFDLDDEEESESTIDQEDEHEEDEDIDLFSVDEEEPETESRNELAQTKYKPINSDFSSLITKDKKIVSFVGTTKNGTSFIVNNAAHMLASIGISTAILDMTKTRNAYYIYTNSEEELMQTAKNSISKLRSGVAEGVKINKNLAVYTSLPEDNNDYTDVEAILSTLVKKYSVVLIDCDFDTPMGYFDASQEIYLVQSMDVLTMQPLTAFLRNLQSKGILKQEKVKVVINKGVKIKSVTVKTLIGGISKYNDPSMTYMKDLFDRDKVNYCVIPFEIPNYIKYLDSVITCSITLNGYTKPFITALKELCNMIYPLINKQTYSPRGDKYKDNFTDQMNETLNQMKRNYN